MLIKALLAAGFWVMNALLSAFPKADTAGLGVIGSKIRDVVGLMKSVDAYLPITEILAAVALFFSVWVVISVIVWVRKVYSAGSGGGGI